MKQVGTRREVFNGKAKETSGHLQKKDLIKNKYHRIVSRKKYFSSRKDNRLEKHGFFAKKNIFGVDLIVKKGKRTIKKTIYTKASKTRKQKK